MKITKGKIIKIGKDSYDVLDCAIPKIIYENKYVNAQIDWPIDLINMFSCRIFEKNPFLIGMDIKDKKYIYYNSLVRKRFINKIKNLQKLKNINKIVNSMAIDLFNYRDRGYKNKYFEEFKKIDVLSHPKGLLTMVRNSSA